MFLKARGIIQAILLGIAGIAGWDLGTTGLDFGNPAFWGNIFAMLGSLGLTFGLSQDRFVQIVTFGRAVVAKYDESDLPNGCNQAMNWIVAGLRRGVDPATLKPFYDSQWEVIVREVAPMSREGG
jgi:hypothetical protein